MAAARLAGWTRGVCADCGVRMATKHNFARHVKVRHPNAVGKPKYQEELEVPTFKIIVVTMLAIVVSICMLLLLSLWGGGFISNYGWLRSMTPFRVRWGWDEDLSTEARLPPPPPAPSTPDIAKEQSKVS